MQYAIEEQLDLKFEDAINVVKQSFKEQGFGVLTEIDVKNTLKEKLGIETGDYIILGACNPHLAHQALNEEPKVGVLLPCNIVLIRNGDKTTIYVMNPEVMSELTGNENIAQLAREAGNRINLALENLKTQVKA